MSVNSSKQIKLFYGVPIDNAIITIQKLKPFSLFYPGT